MKIRALVVEAKDAPFEVQEIDLGQPERGEVLIRIAASGVCHTDAITRAGDLPSRSRVCSAMRAPALSRGSDLV